MNLSERVAFLQQGVNLCVLEFDDLLLALVHQAAETGQQDVVRLEDEGHVRRRNGDSVRTRRMKSSHTDAVIRRLETRCFPTF